MLWSFTGKFQVDVLTRVLFASQGHVACATFELNPGFSSDAAQAKDMARILKQSKYYNS